MPKTSKRDGGKKADFQKAKVKLGKGKQAANNATDTSFKARTIALPQQSIVSDKSGKLVNSRNLTVSDLAPQLRHYSANVRKDAVLGIKDILITHPSLLTSALGQLLPDLVRCIGDDDATVRRQLYSLLFWMLPQIPAPLLAPFHNTLLLFTTSALSHIYPEVRLDAVRVLDICLELMPDVAVQGWEVAVLKMAEPNKIPQATKNASSGSIAHQQHGERIMNCLLNMIGITQRSSVAASITATNLSTGAKLTIIKSFQSFLTHALARSHDRNVQSVSEDELSFPTWFFQSSFNTLSEYEHFEGLLRSRDFAKRVRPANSVVTPEGDLDCGNEYGAGSLMDLDTTVGRSVASSDLLQSLQTAVGGHTAPSTKSGPLSLYELLHPVLLATFLDTAPLAFQPDIDLSHSASLHSAQNSQLSVPVQLLHELLALMLTLWRSSSAAQTSAPSVSARASLRTVLGHMSVYFPFSEQFGSAMSASSKAKSQVVRMDLAYAELIALLSLNISNISREKGKLDLGAQIGHVSAFITKLLAATVVDYGTVTLSSTGSGSTSNPQTFQALLPTLWFLLNAPDHDRLLDALLATYHRYGSTNRVKPMLFEFLARTYLLQFTTSKTNKASESANKVLTSLLSDLPKTLWEVSNASSGHQYAEVMLQFLKFVLLLPTDSPRALAHDGLRPFYCFKHPVKGNMMLGPFAKLPPPLRKLALDIATMLSSEDVKFATTVESLRKIAT